jgi:hypothetical protein
LKVSFPGKHSDSEIGKQKVLRNIFRVSTCWGKKGGRKDGRKEGMDAGRKRDRQREVTVMSSVSLQGTLKPEDFPGLTVVGRKG